MTRYIDADAIVEEMDRYIENFARLGMVVDGNDCFYKVNELLADAPTVDAVEVVRCGECIHRMKNKFCLESTRYEKNDNGYCSYGKRRE